MNKQQIPGVSKVLAVASGKGGVGKSTVAANLAVALAKTGTSVGLLDADIYGPSQGLLMGVAADARPEVAGKTLQPILAHGVQCMSMSFVGTAKTPVVWRGPMASGALVQLMTQTAWRNVDVLVVDMPPGTGDIQLTLAQQVPVTGAVIVTTPQDLALLDARKGIEMFRQVHVPVFGVVENMSTHTCSNCGHEEAIFGTGGGELIAEEYGVGVLARLPLSLEFRDETNSAGSSLPVISHVNGHAAGAFAAMAAAVSSRINAAVVSGPHITVVDD